MCTLGSKDRKVAKDCYNPKDSCPICGNCLNHCLGHNQMATGIKSHGTATRRYGLYQVHVSGTQQLNKLGWPLLQIGV